MKNFADRLTKKISDMNNPTVMGLDPLLEYVPDFLKKDMDLNSKIKKTNEEYLHLAATKILNFNKMLIDSVEGIIPAVKPQIAYYEILGEAGIKVYKETIQYAKRKGIIVIADCKRNDIGSTATMYSKAYIGETNIGENIKIPAFDADALTVNAYMGLDGIAPFIKDCKERGKGIFVLVRTSNPSASDFQDIKSESGEFFYEIVAKKVSEWGKPLIGESGFSSVGAVLGATWPEQARVARRLMPEAMMLVPGYGAQGGTAETVSECFSPNGGGAIVNASRSLMLAYKKTGKNGEDFQEATYKEALRMKNDLARLV